MSFEEQLQAIVSEAIKPLVHEIRELRTKVNGEDHHSLSAREAAEFLGISLNRIRELSHDPSFYPAKWISERRVVFARHHLIRWRDEQQVS